MGAFIVRRTIGAFIVLFAVSLITFAIFIVIPGGDPAVRMAGKNATDENIANIRETWGFDEPFYVQYAKMVEKIFNGDLISYNTQQNVLDEIKRGLPATISLAIGAAIIWLFFGVLVGVISAITARWSDRAITILALSASRCRCSGSASSLAITSARRTRASSRREIRPADREPGAVAVPPDPPVVRARRAVHRLLRARAALELPRLDERGLRAHRQGQGPDAVADPDQARAGTR